MEKILKKKILILILILGNTVFGNTILCTTNSTCAFGSVNCIDNEDCIVQCNGDSESLGVCAGTTINCPATLNKCTINCSNLDGNAGACQSAIINAENVNILEINAGDHSNALRNGIINCPINGECYINCLAVNILSHSYICRSMNVNALNSDNLIINTHGSQSLYGASIHCPNKVGINCIVNVTSLSNGNELNHAIIKAENAWNDVIIDCGGNSCYDDNWNPKLYCDPSWVSFCTLQSINNEWNCIENTSNCIRPTFNPS